MESGRWVVVVGHAGGGTVKDREWSCDVLQVHIAAPSPGACWCEETCPLVLL